MTLHFILFVNQSVVKKTFMYLQKWFHNNGMVLNPGKCYYMTFYLNTTSTEFVLEVSTIVPYAEEHVILGIKIDLHLTFYSHLKQLCIVMTKGDSSTTPFPLDI